MILHQDLTLIILASFVSYFRMHQGSHLAYVNAYHTQLNPTLTLLMYLGRYTGPIFLIWYGFKTVWYYPFLLMTVCIPGVIVLVSIEQAVRLTQRAWVISISGILFVPGLIYLMFTHVNTLGS
jgi:hypothetical protein